MTFLTRRLEHYYFWTFYFYFEVLRLDIGKHSNKMSMYQGIFFIEFIGLKKKSLNIDRVSECVCDSVCVRERVGKMIFRKYWKLIFCAPYEMVETEFFSSSVRHCLFLLERGSIANGQMWAAPKKSDKDV